MSWAIFGFIKDEAIDMEGTSCSIFEVALESRFPEEVQKRAIDILKMFGKRANIQDLPALLSVCIHWEISIVYLHETNDAIMDENMKQETSPVADVTKITVLDLV